MLNHDSRHCKSAETEERKPYGGWFKAEEQSTFIPEWSEELSEGCHLVVSPAETPVQQAASKRVTEEETSRITKLTPGFRNHDTLVFDPQSAQTMRSEIVGEFSGSYGIYDSLGSQSSNNAISGSLAEIKCQLRGIGNKEVKSGSDDNGVGLGAAQAQPKMDQAGKSAQTI